MGKVLDFRGRSPNSPHLKENLSSIGIGEGELVDITALREAEISAERRNVRRTILTEFIAVHAVVPNFGLLKVSLYNINNNGLAFDLEEVRGSFKEGEELPLRVYLNHQTYFPFLVTIRHITHVQDEGIARHGCEFVKGSINDIALQHLVGFLENVSANLRNDRGDVQVSNINS